MSEYVVLVNDNNEPIGKVLKSEVHTSDTPLHRAFSLFIFNSKGQLLKQQRSHDKITWPGIWSNSCCGHPGPGEATDDAVKRRVQEELGLKLDTVTEMLPNYRYRAELDGIVEHEICPVFVAVTDEEPVINTDEVEAAIWITWPEFQTEVTSGTLPYTPWCIEETQLLHNSDNFNTWYTEVIKKGDN